MAEPILILAILGVVFLHYLLPAKYRALFLTIASLGMLGFYSVPGLIALLVFALFNFIFATIVRYSKPLLAIGILCNVTVIILFNYFTMKGNGIDFQLAAVNFSLNSFIVTIGISFYALQHIAYLVEVYNERMKVEKSLIHYILYQAFFPRVISGPIMQPSAFFKQIPVRSISNSDLVAGSQRALFGLFKKLVLADGLAPSVHSVFDFPGSAAGLTIWVATCLFSLQLYFDFSGYTDMAIGLARMMGYELPENFKTPFRSLSIAEFWRRWHISLIQWFSTYLYYPVVYFFRKYKMVAALLGILITFSISGVWHGIGWCFVTWSLLHALYLSVELITRKKRLHWFGTSNSTIFKFFCASLVFVLVSFSNLFFRAPAFSRALEMLKGLFDPNHFWPSQFGKDFIAPLAVGGHQLEEFNFYLLITLVLGFLFWELKWSALAESKHWKVGYTAILVILIFLLGSFGSNERFIYMQF